MLKLEELNAGNHKYLPIIALLLFFLMELNYTILVAEAQNDISYLILAITVSQPLLIGMLIATIRLKKEKNQE
ncbi:MAG: hypothetical protein ACTSR8_10510 [Promethearchaeota archaeon]